MAKILIIDDEPSILESLEMFLGEKGHSVFKADTAKKGTFFLPGKRRKWSYWTSACRI